MTRPLTESRHGDRSIQVAATLRGVRDQVLPSAQEPFGEPHRILSYFSGEVPIHAAAMLLDPGSRLEIYFDTDPTELVDVAPHARVLAHYCVRNVTAGPSRTCAG